MRDTTKTITFDFEFAYSYQGNIVKGNQITVVEPSFADRATYRQMKSWMAEGFKGLAKMTDNDVRRKSAEMDAESPPSPPPADPDVPHVVDDGEAYVILSLGLDGSRFAEMAAWIEKVLTNNKRLAYCGTDADGAVPITEPVWNAIAREGGMDAVERVCSAFAGFFMNGPSRQTTASNGSETVVGLPPDPLAPSPTPRRKR